MADPLTPLAPPLSVRLHPTKLACLQAALKDFDLEPFRSAVVVITGARGYFGRYLVESFLLMNEMLPSLGVKVIAMDSDALGTGDTWGDWVNLPNLTHFKHDVRHTLGHLYGERPTHIFHLAGIASPHWYKKLPLETIDVAVKGTREMLDLAKEYKAKFLFTSSSEVYQTADKVPTPETYVGAIPSFSDRSCYDVSKLLAETLCYTYAALHNVHATVVRIFNSVLGDEWVTFCDQDGTHVERAEDAARMLGLGEVQKLKGVRVPTLNPVSGKSSVQEASHWIGHLHQKPCIEISTRYGRKIRITQDHSIFKRGLDGGAVPTEGKEIKVGDYVALAGRISTPERDLEVVDLEPILSLAWGAEAVNVQFVGLGDVLRQRQQDVVQARRAIGLNESGLWSLKDASFERTSSAVLAALKIPIPHDARVSPRSAGATTSLPGRVKISNDLLWVLGLFVAEGSFVDTEKDSCVVFSSDTASINHAAKALATELGVHVQLSHNSTGAPTARVSSKALLELWKHLSLVPGLAKDKRIPPWVLALPLGRLKFFLDGYRAGDGVHSGKKVGIRHEFSTASEGLKNDLIVAFGRFGLVPSIGKYISNIEKRYPGKRYPFWRVTLAKTFPWSMLEWDKGVTQPLQAPRTGDIVWALVKSVTPVEPTSKVYDFSVPGVENFVTGQGVMAHNSFGPGMAQADKRILTRVAEAIKQGGVIQVYSTKAQQNSLEPLPSRTYTPVANTLRGVLLASAKGESVGQYTARTAQGVYNVGSPSPELSVVDLIWRIRKVLPGVPSQFQYAPQPQEYETEPLRRCPDITRLKALGYKEAMTLEEGLALFFKWSQEVYR